MKYIIEYCGQTAMVSNVEESINAIQSFHSYGRKNNPFIQVNSYVLSALSELFERGEFNGQRFPLLRTTGCGCKDICFHEPLGDTLVEHEANYRAKCEAEKAKRIRRAEEAKQRLLAEYSEVRRGWYYVEVEVEAHDFDSCRPKYLTSSGYGIADSKMDAYKKFVGNVETLRDQCIRHNASFFSCSEWNSCNTQVDFLGMKTDEGYSIDAWEEARKNGKI